MAVEIKPVITVRTRLFSWAIGWLYLVGCAPTGQSLPPAEQTATTPVRSRSVATDSGQESRIESGPFQFSEVAGSTGLRFRHYSPLTEQRHVHLVMGSGVGWIDFDRDGWPDLYCCQGASFDRDSNEEPPSNALFGNRGGETFSEVTRAAGLLDTSYSMGVAAADYDNDGFADLCITGYESNRLYHNNGDGTFNLVGLPNQSSPGRLSASCAWGDVDADGDLDLFITNYAKLGPDNYPICDYTGAGKTIHVVCHPSFLEAVPDLLYRNIGDGRFADSSEEAGIRAVKAHQGLGVVAADLDADGDTDFYVANDTTGNHLWQNQGSGQFDERGGEAGTSTNKHGAREAGMGVAIGDVDGTGTLDLFVANYFNETNTLYRNEGRLLFSDVTDEMGLGAPSRLRLAFGASFADFDNDGWLDVLTANGHVHDRLHEIGREGPFAQLPQVFYNDRGSRFRDVSLSSGAYFHDPHVGRGTAIADFDRDGHADVAISQLNSDVVLLKNDAADIGRWLQVELVGVQSNRDGVGAMVQLDLGERRLVRSVQAGVSYLSCDERVRLIGIGSLDKVREVTVVWPGGRRESWADLEANRLWRLVEGNGIDANLNNVR
jgi:hypothetical protein